MSSYCYFHIQNLSIPGLAASSSAKNAINSLVLSCSTATPCRFISFVNQFLYFTFNGFGVFKKANSCLMLCVLQYVCIWLNSPMFKQLTVVQVSNFIFL